MEAALYGMRSDRPETQSTLLDAWRQVSFQGPGNPELSTSHGYGLHKSSIIDITDRPCNKLIKETFTRLQPRTHKQKTAERIS
jgi:hypothetical protein